MDMNKLPICENMDSFLKLNSDLSVERVESFIGKYVYLEQKVEDGLMNIYGRLVANKDDKLFVLIGDDGTDDDISELTMDEAKDFSNEFSIDTIIGLEELKKYNEELVFKDEYKNQVVKITNIYDKSAIVYIVNCENNILEYQFKYDEENISDVLEYPFWLITKIEII